MAYFDWQVCWLTSAAWSHWSWTLHWAFPTIMWLPVQDRASQKPLLQLCWVKFEYFIILLLQWAEESDSLCFAYSLWAWQLALAELSTLFFIPEWVYKQSYISYQPETVNNYYYHYIVHCVTDKSCLVVDIHEVLHIWKSMSLKFELSSNVIFFQHYTEFIVIQHLYIRLPSLKMHPNINFTIYPIFKTQKSHAAHLTQWMRGTIETSF